MGNQGDFDTMAKNTLKKLKEKYLHIDYSIVLAYIPSKKESYKYISDTIYPDGLETVPKRFAIDRRNRWLINHSDYMVVYVEHSFGGASKFYELALKKKKNVINLYNAEKC